MFKRFINITSPKSTKSLYELNENGKFVALAKQQNLVSIRIYPPNNHQLIKNQEPAVLQVASCPGQDLAHPLQVSEILITAIYFPPSIIYN